ncbi:nuclear transport factor 2 family protein [Actinoallomurus purpureus]|uniref:nuclear transport factor 2 family protein n=1 Tax=Actinoallomurus purpureus TaxID=478114 RepID=UPI002093A86C|nr:nuclear transport factor 2 family protein [Actinoallomurus purpureus]MCO6007580.1 nuclear transport factor 2 family protein [Actinoallomurus purpureus]
MPAIAPRAVIETLVSLTATGPTEKMADLFTEDAIFEAPTAPPGAPVREVGRETFRAHLAAGVKIQEFTGIDQVTIHETADAEVVITEYRLHGRRFTTDALFTTDIVMITRVRDGLITWIRTYAHENAEPAAA